MQSNRKTRRDFVRDNAARPYELELENPVDGGPAYVTFKNPHRLESQTAFELNRETDPELQIRALLSEEDFAAWWAEWRTAPVEETNALLEDITDHYGAGRKATR